MAYDLGPPSPPRRGIKMTDCYFYTTMQIPGYGKVKGDWDLLDFDQYVGGVEVKGKTVLDVGAASGYLSFEAERRGARVVSYDASSIAHTWRIPFQSNLYSQDRETWAREMEPGLERVKNSYWLAHEAFGSQAEVRYGDVYRLERVVPRCEVLLAGAILEHLNDPLSALGSFARVCAETLVIAFTNVFKTNELIAKPLLPLTDPRFDYTWWAYSRGLYARILQNVGFEVMAIRPCRARNEAAGQIVERQTLIARRKR